MAASEWRKDYLEFQSAPPVKGGDLAEPGGGSSSAFQSAPPVKGGDHGKHDIYASQWSFNPRPP